MCRNAADLMIGTKSADRSAPAWRQAYRSVEHGHPKRQCRTNDVMSRFPQEIQDFGDTFVKLQKERHRADYDPAERFGLSDVLEAIDAAENAISAFEDSPIKHRRAFAAWTEMRARS